jgi:hypothetical protein
MDAKVALSISKVKMCRVFSEDSAELLFFCAIVTDLRASQAVCSRLAEPGRESPPSRQQNHLGLFLTFQA